MWDSTRLQCPFYDWFGVEVSLMYYCVLLCGVDDFPSRSNDDRLPNPHQRYFDTNMEDFMKSFLLFSSLLDGVELA